jgi:hypothetical protein
LNAAFKLSARGNASAIRRTNSVRIGIVGRGNARILRRVILFRQPFWARFHPNKTLHNVEKRPKRVPSQARQRDFNRVHFSRSHALHHMRVCSLFPPSRPRCLERAQSWSWRLKMRATQTWRAASRPQRWGSRRRSSEARLCADQTLNCPNTTRITTMDQWLPGEYRAPLFGTRHYRRKHAAEEIGFS